MKYFVVLALCLSAAVADHPLDLHSRVNSIRDIHYSQHSQTVGDAKRIVSQKLGGIHASASDAGQHLQSSLEDIDSYGVGTVGSSSSVLGSGSSGSGYSGSYSSSSGSQSGNQQVLHENYDNSGLVNAGSSSAINTEYSSSSQNSGLGSVVIPVAGSESYAEQAERRVEGGSSPVVITSPVGASESYSHHQESRVQNQGAPIYVSSPSSAGSESYSHHEERRVKNQAAPVFIAPSRGAESYSRHEERRVQNQAVPVIVGPIGGSESFSRQEERRIQNQASPLYISSPSSGSESYSHHQEQRIQQAAIPTVYTPSGSSESYVHHRRQRIQSQALPIIYSSPSGTSESYSHRSEEVVQSQPPIIYTPSAGSESYSKMSKFSSQSQAAPLAIVPSIGLSSHSSLLNSQSQVLPAATYFPSQNYYDRLSEGSSSSQIVPSYNTIVTPGADASEFSYTHESSKSQSIPRVIYTNPLSNSHSSYTSSQSSRNSGSNLLPIVTGLGTTSIDTVGSSGFGSHSSLYDTGLRTSSGLGRYMTESERLARMQAQDVGVGGFRSGSSQLNLDRSSSFGGGLGFSNLGSGNTDGNYRSKSWEKSSKWASGTQFGSDGRPNNYNLLSTAEAENHDINGRQAGYKAATTTLDDNGKVSTYSIHS